MTDTVKGQIRIILNLGKYRVEEVTAGRMKIALGGSTTMTAELPSYVDVRAGDLLTFYTEAPIAKSSAAPKQ